MTTHADYNKRMEKDRIKKLKKDYQELKKDFINARINGLYDKELGFKYIKELSK